MIVFRNLMEFAKGNRFDPSLTTCICNVMYPKKGTDNKKAKIKKHKKVHKKA